ncbi:MAG: tetratricopeptide repeat protein, partial [Candidatus Wallbacteria bacterium]|nr:tetratricopeptide repeat protein [Candidatus Wallbacteria bacterium]
PQPDQAVKILLESVKSDGTEAYRLSAYHAGRSVFLEDKAADEQTYLAEIKYLEGVYAGSGDPEVKATALYDMGSVYRWKLGPLTSLSRDKRIDYYKKGGAVYRRCADEFPQWKTADRVLEFSAGCYGGGEIHRLLAERKDEREECYLLAIDAYDKLRSLYPQSLSYEYALSDTAYLYSQIGFMTYLDEHNHSVTLQYKREFLTLSIETHRQYLKEFPGKKDASVNYSIGINYKNIAFSYRLEQDLANAEANYIESNRAYETGIAINPTDYNAISMRFGIGDNCRSIALCYRFIAPNSQTQLKWAREAEKAYLFVASDTSQMAYYRASAMSTIGDVWREYRDFETAVQWYDRVITEYGNDDYGKIIAAISCFSKAECLYELGRYDEGLTAAENYFCYEIIFPDLKVFCDALANKAKGKCLYGLSRNSEAEASLNEALSYGYYDSEEEYRADALLFRGKAREAQGDHRGAHRDLAEVVAKYKDRYWWYDLYTTDSKEELETRVLRVKIDPMIDTIAQGESKTFTASIVYPDDTPASVPATAATNWQWTCTGTPGEDFNLTSSGNSATYTHLKGDFSDRIITAKCKINAGMYGAKGRNKAVEPYIWIEGDNQVPVSIVNEDGKRIGRVPKYVPGWGKHFGPSSYHQGPFGLSISFNSHYEPGSPCSIEVTYCSDTDLGTIVLTMNRKGTSEIFESEAGDTEPPFTVALETPKACTRVTSYSAYEPGSVKMSVLFTGDGHTSERMEIPIWTMQDESTLYFASNIVFPESSCTDLDPEKYIPKNAKFYVQVKDANPSPPPVISKVPYVVARIRSTETGFKSVECIKTGRDTYRSRPFYAVPPSYTDETITVRGVECFALQVDPADTRPDIRVEYDSEGKVIKGLDLYCNNNAYVASTFVGWGTENKINPVDAIAELICKLNCYPVRDMSPTKHRINIAMNKCRIFYIYTHGAFKKYWFKNNEYLGIWVFDHYKSTSSGKDAVLSPDDLELVTTPVDFVFFNACRSGINHDVEPEKTEPLKAAYENQNALVEQFILKFQAAAYLSWKRSMLRSVAPGFASMLFTQLETQNIADSLTSVFQDSAFFSLLKEEPAPAGNLDQTLYK